MNFYQNISPFIDYLFSIRKLKDYISFDLLLPNKWSLPKNLPEGVETVPFKVEENESKGTSFVSQMNEENISKLILVITKTIKLNKEREMKEVLFKQTIDELKKTFEHNDLDTLQRLYFDFENEEPNLEEDEQNGQDTATLELAE